jgi:hypothetical protein
MKKLRRIIFSMVMVVLFTSTQALAFDFYGFGSYWEKSDVDGGKWGGGIGLSVPLFTEYVRLDGRVYYFESSEFGNDNEISFIPLDLGLQLHLLPEAVVDVYALGGISYVYVDADRFDADSDFGGYVGGGLEWAIPNSIVKIFGELAYRFHEVNINDRLDDIDVSGLTANIGIKLHF